MVLRLSAWGIFLLGAVGLLIHSTLLQTGHIRAGMFCFYTNLSNLLVLVYELALAIAAGLPHSAALRLLTDDLTETCSMHEFYNPFDGKPVMNGGFINWNILALTMARELTE